LLNEKKTCAQQQTSTTSLRCAVPVCHRYKQA